MRSAQEPGPTTDEEALQEEFLGALEALGGSAGNGRLRELLGWEEAPYEAVKALLLASGQLRTGQGRGGSVSLADRAGDEGDVDPGKESRMNESLQPAKLGRGLDHETHQADARADLPQALARRASALQ